MKTGKKKNNSKWKNANLQMRQTVMDFSNGYIDFLNEVKTEREAVAKIIEMAKQHGYKYIST